MLYSKATGRNSLVVQGTSSPFLIAYGYLYYCIGHQTINRLQTSSSNTMDMSLVHANLSALCYGIEENDTNDIMISIVDIQRATGTTILHYVCEYVRGMTDVVTIVFFLFQKLFPSARFGLSFIRSWHLLISFLLLEWNRENKVDDIVHH